MDRKTRQKINKEIDHVHYTIYKLNLTEIYNTLHPTTQYTLFSSTRGTTGSAI